MFIYAHDVTFDRYTRWIFLCLDLLLIPFNTVFTLSRLGFYGQLLEQPTVASLSHSTVFVTVVLWAKK